MPTDTPPAAAQQPRRDHFYTVTVFVPTDVAVGEDRTRWYLDHAIRGYHRSFAIEGDPIRGMSRCSVSVQKTPIKDAPRYTAADLTRARAAQEAGDAG